VNISLGEHGSAIIVKVGEKIERYSLAGHPDSGSRAVEDEIQAVQHEIDLPSSASLLKNTGQLLFLAYSARQGSADEEKAYDLLAAFSRWLRKKSHTPGASRCSIMSLGGGIHVCALFTAERVSRRWKIIRLFF
jgi:hypothetical protein